MYRKYPRAKWFKYNYGEFFVTVVTRNRVHYFGEVHDEEMVLSPLGLKLRDILSLCESHYKDVSIDFFIVMPNHFHLLLRIGTESHREESINLGCIKAPAHGDTEDEFSLRHHHGCRLSTVVGGIKSALSKEAKRMGISFGWQTGYHDHIIRNVREYMYISDYIVNNPSRWNRDIINEVNIAGLTP